MSGTTRYKIVSLLKKKGVLCVADVAGALKMTHSAISHQLGLLRAADIVKCEERGREALYSLTKSKNGQLATSILEI